VGACGSMAQHLPGVAAAGGAGMSHAGGRGERLRMARCCRRRSSCTPIAGEHTGRHGGPHLCPCENSQRAEAGSSSDWAKVKNIVYIA